MKAFVAVLAFVVAVSADAPIQEPSNYLQPPLEQYSHTSKDFNAPWTEQNLWQPIADPQQPINVVQTGSLAPAYHHNTEYNPSTVQAIQVTHPDWATSFSNVQRYEAPWPAVAIAPVMIPVGPVFQAPAPFSKPSAPVVTYSDSYNNNYNNNHIDHQSYNNNYDHHNNDLHSNNLHNNDVHNNNGYNYDNNIEHHNHNEGYNYGNNNNNDRHNHINGYNYDNTNNNEHHNNNNGYNHDNSNNNDHHNHHHNNNNNGYTYANKHNNEASKWNSWNTNSNNNNNNYYSHKPTTMAVHGHHEAVKAKIPIAKYVAITPGAIHIAPLPGHTVSHKIINLGSATAGSW